MIIKIEYNDDEKEVAEIINNIIKNHLSMAKLNYDIKINNENYEN